MAETRPYVSRKREIQAQDTRQRILAAARKLFAQQGYTATTIEAVAREASVSAPSVYQHFRNKAGLIRAQLGAIDAAGEVEALQAAIRDFEAPPRRQAAALARFIGSTSDIVAPLAVAARGSEDSELRELAAGDYARHIRGTAALARQWGERGLLRIGLSPERAGQVLAVIASSTIFSDLRETHGWSAEDAEAWMVTAISDLLMKRETQGLATTHRVTPPRSWLPARVDRGMRIPPHRRHDPAHARAAW